MMIQESLCKMHISILQVLPKYPMYFIGTLIFLHTTMISLRYIVAFLNVGWDVVVVVVVVVVMYY